jgi:hypothetical protein
MEKYLTGMNIFFNFSKEEVNLRVLAEGLKHCSDV